ncbi:MAG: hypothetical protein HC780_27980 [Leptolyngbyaceae cyanobacterium CSU_1_3]|nr:hypothetical protein [Leptolyngbyaceae cyanobacterium CSU_1_3]
MLKTLAAVDLEVGNLAGIFSPFSKTKLQTFSFGWLHQPLPLTKSQQP